MSMVPTAPCRRQTTHWAPPPCDELDPQYDIKLVFVQKITFVLRKLDKKTAATRAALFDSNVTYKPNLDIGSRRGAVSNI